MYLFLVTAPIPQSESEKSDKDISQKVIFGETALWENARVDRSIDKWMNPSFLLPLKILTDDRIKSRRPAGPSTS